MDPLPTPTSPSPRCCKQADEHGPVADASRRAGARPRHVLTSQTPQPHPEPRRPAFPCPLARVGATCCPRLARLIRPWRAGQATPQRGSPRRSSGLAVARAILRARSTSCAQHVVDSPRHPSSSQCENPVSTPVLINFLLVVSH
jgi:hypothetical protein